MGAQAQQANLKNKQSGAVQQNQRRVFVVNNSGTTIHFQFFAGNNDCSHAYSTIVRSVAPGGKLEWGSGGSKLEWLGQMPQGPFQFNAAKVIYMNESGSCEVYGDQLIGAADCKQKGNIEIDLTQCNGTGKINAIWTNVDGLVTLTFN